MQRFLRYLMVHCVIISGLLFAADRGSAQPVFYHDRALFTAALGGLLSFTDDYESYAFGDIPLGGRRGDFLYQFDPNVVQPTVADDFAGGKALGGVTPFSPFFEVFVQGDSVTLCYQPLPPLPAAGLLAFGADFIYAPAFDTIPADTYRLGIEDGAAAGQFGGNLPLPGSFFGGSFFLGVIADPSDAFTKVSLSSVQVDPNFLVPAYQVDNLIYATPEPHTIWMLAIGAVVLLVVGRRRKESRSS